MKQNIRETINQNNFIVHNIKGISMLPLFVENEDTVYIEKIKEKPKKLDIILFTRKTSNVYILHRILEIKKRYYLVCGDNQNRLEKVYPSQIIGKVTGYYKKKRYVSIEDREYLEYLDNLELDLNKRTIITINIKHYKDLLSLIKSTIHNIKIDQRDFDFEKIYKIADKYSVAPFVFKTIDKKKCDKSTYLKFNHKYNQCIQRTMLFEDEKTKVFVELNKNNIKYIPLKGSAINSLYPEYGTRLTTDVDIYIKSSDKITSIMNKLGYQLYEESDLDLAFHKQPIYNFEMHKILFYNNQPYAKYFDNLFSKAINIKGCEYTLDNENFYALFIAHFHKHNSWSGTGIRFYIDLYYILQNKKFDKDRLDEILKETNLKDFSDQAIKRMNNLLNDEEPSPTVISSAFPGSTYGSRSFRINKIGKYNYIIKRVFPPASIYCPENKIIKKIPFLIVFVWIYRIISPKRWPIIAYEIKHMPKKIG